jgi:hypothetical protein
MSAPIAAGMQDGDRQPLLAIEEPLRALTIVARASGSVRTGDRRRRDRRRPDHGERCACRHRTILEFGARTAAGGAGSTCCRAGSGQGAEGSPGQCGRREDSASFLVAPATRGRNRIGDVPEGEGGTGGPRGRRCGRRRGTSPRRWDAVAFSFDFPRILTRRPGSPWAAFCCPRLACRRRDGPRDAFGQHLTPRKHLFSRYRRDDKLIWLADNEKNVPPRSGKNVPQHPLQQTPELPAIEPHDRGRYTHWIGIHWRNEPPDADALR